MRIAFYAPMKPPDHPTASGDRQVARLLIRALERLGHTVDIVSRLRTWRREPADNDEIAAASGTESERIVAAGGFDLFLTYHLYHKAPDLIGPAVAERLRIPYVVIEASHAEHRRGGPWTVGLERAEAAIRAADAVAALHRRDRRGLEPLVDAERLFDLAPFIDAGTFRDVPAVRAERSGDNGPVRLATVAMMREGDKLSSYRVLGAALEHLGDLDWTLTIAGDGPARAEVERLLPAGRSRFCGLVASDAIADIYAGADIFVWPAVREAYGLVFLEAMASGLPVVGGLNGGVPDVVIDGVTGLLPPPDDPVAQAAAIRLLLTDTERRRRMGQAAREHVLSRHNMNSAMKTLSDMIDFARGIPRCG